MTIEQFIQNVTEMWKAVEGKTDDSALVLMAGNGRNKAYAVMQGSASGLRFLVASCIDYRNGECSEQLYGVIRDSFGIELTARVTAGVATGVQSIASRNIKDGKYIVKPPKEKS